MLTSFLMFYWYNEISLSYSTPVVYQVYRYYPGLGAMASGHVTCVDTIKPNQHTKLNGIIWSWYPETKYLLQSPFWSKLRSLRMYNVHVKNNYFQTNRSFCSRGTCSHLQISLGRILWSFGFRHELIFLLCFSVLLSTSIGLGIFAFLHM